MITHKTILLLVAVMVCLSQPVNAHNTRGDPRGSFGGHSCGTWHEVRKQDKLSVGQQALTSWVVGFLSGLNMHAAAKNIWGKTNPLTASQISLWLDKYCRENPLSSIRNGAWDLFRTLPDHRLMIVK